jgi:hypothetical protein
MVLHFSILSDGENRPERKLGKALNWLISLAFAVLQPWQSARVLLPLQEARQIGKATTA